ncbi:MAG: 4-(cytidine 5'-diphospho)-2-C-methyl-D-erythritol kinase [Lachnospiraceae bacterium]|nr:4-(cytidine 5'-diphospho)-2-C-methyl-D-erythritol kinase [Lachnospiraceae bacterium]
MSELKLKARAKINLGLDVIRKREDGYHDLRMVMQTIGLCDELVLSQVETEGIFVSTNRPELPTDERNLVYRAARLLREEFGLPGGIRIHLEKKIPMAAGLAGGSTDAAAVLKGMNDLYSLGLSEAQLCERGVKLGADIPYCIMGGTALAEGIGERLTRLPEAPQCSVLLTKPWIDVSTAFVYGHLRADELQDHPDIDGQIAAVWSGDFSGMTEKMGNVLETVTIPAYPVVQEIKEEMLELGAAGAMMSGSGPTVFGLFDDREKAEAAYRRMCENGAGRDVFLTEFFQPDGREQDR